MTTEMLLQAKLAQQQPEEYSTTADVAEAAMPTASDPVQISQETEKPADADGSESCNPRPTPIQQLPADCQDTSITPAPEEPFSKPDCEECIICWDACASVVLQPCGHMLACLGCIELLADLPCPMCHRPVVSSVCLEV